MNTDNEALTVEALSDQFPFEEDDEWAEDDKPTIWNAYVYVVGTDRSGKSDFNVMRELLQKETTFEYPWVAITYDYKKGESDASKGEIRKRWKKSSSSKAKDETFKLGEEFGIVYSDIEGMAANNQTIRHLHILTHSGSQAIYYSSNSTNVDDLKKLDQKKFKSAFHKDALVKIHGCHVDKDIRKKVRDFCETTKTATMTDILKEIRSEVEKSYAFKLAEFIDKPVFATPMGAGAVYNCSYLKSDENGKRFCIETSETAENTRRLTVRFFEANYDQIFDRASSEKVFDKTYHMKYKPSLRSLKTLSPVACAKDVPAREAIEDFEYNSEADDIDEFEYEPYVEPAVMTYARPSMVECADIAISDRMVAESSSLFAHMLSNAEASQALIAPAMRNSRLLAPAPIFDALAYGKYPEAAAYYNRLFEVVALPGSRVNDLRPGDCVLRRALGEANFGHAAVVVDGALIRRADLAFSGLRPEGSLPGLYVHVVDTGPFPHRVEDRFARRLADENGRLGYDTLVIRFRSNGRGYREAEAATLPIWPEYDAAEVVERFTAADHIDIDDEWARVIHYTETVTSCNDIVETPIFDRAAFGAALPELERLRLIRPVAPPAGGTLPPGTPNYEFRLRSRIYYPRGPRVGTMAGIRAYPVVVIVHGNHNVTLPNGTEIRSYRGYEYLQQELARHGIISMSIDTNHSNSLDADIRTRAETIFANLRILERLNNTQGHVLRNRLDLRNIGLMGHSRGGDGVVKAVIQNRGTQTYRFRAVCLLAPSDLSSDYDATPPNNIPSSSYWLRLQSCDQLRLLVLYGSLDGDICGVFNTGTGFRHYDRATCDRTMIFAEGFTHNRFNTSWDDPRLRPYGDVFHRFARPAVCQTTPPGPTCPSAPATLRTPSAHQQLAIDYIGALFRLELNGDATRLNLLNGLDVPAGNRTVSIQWCFGERLEIENFDSPAMNALAGASVYTNTRTMLFTKPPTATPGAPPGEISHLTNVLVANTPGATYRSDIPPNRSNWSRFNTFLLRMTSRFDISSAAAIGAGPFPSFRLRVRYRPPGGAIAVAEVNQINIDTRGVRAPKRPFFHEIYGPALGRPDPLNVTKLALETIVIPFSEFRVPSWNDVLSIEFVAGPAVPIPIIVDSLAVVRA